MSEAKLIVQHFKKRIETLSKGMRETISSRVKFIGLIAKDVALIYREKERVAIGLALYSRYTPVPIRARIDPQCRVANYKILKKSEPQYLRRAQR